VILPGSRKPLHAPFETPDPFLMAVYHKDAYPAGDGLMQAPRRGNGADFSGQGGYSMYHGDRVPGFPQHPHRGFETITATLQGYIDHTDSQGWSGRYGEGDLQWMTAGRGVVHGEMFPLIHTDRPNPTRFFQIWLNLPPESKMAEPAFVMHWASEIPTLSIPSTAAHGSSSSSSSNASAIVWAGPLLGATPLGPPPDSWAARPENAVAVWFVSLPAGSSLTLPPVNISNEEARRINRALYLLEGDELSVGGETLTGRTTCRLDPTKSALLRGPAAAGAPPAEALVLQGRPIGAPVAQRGPFVMNTQAEIQQAYGA
jgi:redox-sensitive bicupin YhaK (pirin superfamily)